MKHYTFEDIAADVLAARGGRTADAALSRHLAECAECRETADTVQAIAGAGAGAARLSFDDLYDYHFGTPTAEHRAAVEGVLAQCPRSAEYSRLFRGLPGEEQALRENPALPADLKAVVFASLATEMPSEGVLSRLSAAAREFVERVKETADAFVLSLSSAAAGLVRLARVSASVEPAYAYDGTAPAAPPAPPALAALPRIRVEHGYLCLALAGDTPYDVEVALIDATGREAARAKPNTIGVVMFDRLSPGTYGVKVGG